MTPSLSVIGTAPTPPCPSGCPRRSPRVLASLLLLWLGIRAQILATYLAIQWNRLTCPRRRLFVVTPLGGVVTPRMRDGRSPECLAKGRTTGELWTACVMNLSSETFAPESDCLVVHYLDWESGSTMMWACHVGSARDVPLPWHLPPRLFSPYRIVTAVADGTRDVTDFAARALGGCVDADHLDAKCLFACAWSDGVVAREEMAVTVRRGPRTVSLVLTPIDSDLRETFPLTTDVLISIAS